MNKIRDKPQLLVKISDETISDITENLEKFYIEYKYIQNLTGFSQKRLNLWLFRHKDEIKTLKFEKQKFVSLNILEFLPKMVKNYQRRK